MRIRQIITLFMIALFSLAVRYLWMSKSKRPDRKERKRLEQEGKLMEREVKVDYILTDLDERQLPVEKVLETYNDRPTIERYFYDEQYSLGAKQVRTRHYAGEAMFQFIVATTNNVRDGSSIARSKGRYWSR